MIAVHLPSFDDETAAMDWVHGQGDVVRVVLMRGMDGMVRGTALLRPAAAVSKDLPGGDHAEEDRGETEAVPDGDPRRAPADR